ncbi:MAG: (Fe-S)-binding protein [Desulfobulbaceae bacterium]|nr:MAG: (Fe-S)-binding protein [Desulfobulbaceae bacterium]
MKNIRCAKCGACTVVCPVFKASGGMEAYSARGRNHLASVKEYQHPTPEFEDIFATCLLCGACTKACPRGIDVTGETIRARSRFSRFYGRHGFAKFLARRALRHPQVLGPARRLGKAASRLSRRLPSDSGLRLRLAMFESPEPQDQLAETKTSPPSRSGGEQLVYFPGCSAEYLYPGIANACRELLADSGQHLVSPDGLGCCGLALHAAGETETAKELARRNIEVLEGQRGTILVSCASCFAHLRQYPELLAEEPEWRERAAAIGGRLAEMMQFLDRLPAPSAARMEKTGAGPVLRVFYHDPCHLRHGVGITKEPRRILGRLPNVELVELPDGPQCCGQGGLFHIGAPELSAMIRNDLTARVMKLRPDIVTSTCSGCLMQWQTALTAAGSTVRVMHLAELLRLRA